jgi:ATP-dependent Clp protease protease subunit
VIDQNAQDIYSRLFQDGIVFVRGEINDDMAMTVTAQLLFLASEAPGRDIHLYINSPGGSLSAALSIYDAMQIVGPKVVTVCTGMAASGGSLLLASGAAGSRMSLPHSQIHIHQPLTEKFEGRAGDIETYAKEMLQQRERMARIYAKHCNRPLEAVERDIERDFFMTPEQAKDWGLIDAIVDKSPMPPSR